MMEARPYQVEAIQGVLSAFESRRSTLLVMMTGAGKTICFAKLAEHFAQKGERTLVLAHREELLTQAQDKIAKATGLSAEIEKAQKRASLESTIVVASVQSLNAKRLTRWPQDHFGLVVVDECFPSGTLVDGRPIESLTPGDFVCSFSHGQSCLQWRRVVAASRKRPSTLLTIHTKLGRRITCTHEHPIFSKSKYKRAIDLQPNNELLIYATPTTRKTVSELRKARFSVPKNKAYVLHKRQSVLLHGMHVELLPSHSIRNDGSNQSPLCIQEDDGSQSDEGAECSRKSEEFSSSNWPQAANSWGQWDWPNSSRKTTYQCSQVRMECRSEDGGEEGYRLPVQLQDRSWFPIVKNRNRGGRKQSFHSIQKGSGHEEAGILGRDWVDHIEVHEQTSDGRFGGMCPDGFVYNLEVEDNANFFANEALVHNCHHARAKSYTKILDHFKSAKLLGTTATPDRGDRKSLATVFESVAYEAGLMKLIKEGWLSKIMVQRMPIEIDLRRVRKVAGDYKVDDVDHAIEPKLMDVARAMASECWDRKSVVFLPLVKTARRFAEMLESVGIEARAVAGEDAPDLRKGVLDWFSGAGPGTALCNAMLLTEGWDQPDVDCVVCLRPTQVRALYAQMVGRGVRIYPGKSDCLLLDFLWMTDEHNLAKAVHLVAGKEDVAEALDKTIDKADGPVDLLDEEEQAERDVEAERIAKLLERLKANRKRTPGTFDIHDLATMINEEELLTYEPKFVFVPGVGFRMENPPSEKQKAYLHTLGVDPEAINSATHASKIIDKLHARRREHLATLKQVRLLRKFGHPAPDKATFTEASRFIDFHYGKISSHHGNRMASI